MSISAKKLSKCYGARHLHEAHPLTSTAVLRKSTSTRPRPWRREVPGQTRLLRNVLQLRISPGPHNPHFAAYLRRRALDDDQHKSRRATDQAIIYDESEFCAQKLKNDGVQNTRAFSFMVLFLDFAFPKISEPGTYLASAGISPGHQVLPTRAQPRDFPLVSKSRSFNPLTLSKPGFFLGSKNQGGHIVPP